MLNKKTINKVIDESAWDLGNRVLYDLCKKNPQHQDYPEILAKVWLIGRSYAAAIERRKSEAVKPGEDFYMDKVAPIIYNSSIDSWFSALKKYKTINKNSIPCILETHKKVTKLFTDISQLQKRSLASKYLHFHFPNLYFIYDSRALKSISKLSDYTGNIRKSNYESDNEYRKLFEKCLALRTYINNKYNINLSPRHIDNLLLMLDRNVQ